MKIKDKKDFLILVLGIVAIALLLVVLYVFVVQPKLNGLIIQGQSEGYQYTILSIAQQAATCQIVPLTVGNQTINLIAVDCLQNNAASE
jgi:hypothetical protein